MTNEEPRIPSEQALAFAKQRARERSLNLDVVRNSLMEKFSPLCNLDNIYVIPEGDFQFRVAVFFSSDKDVIACMDSGLCQSIQDHAFDEVERVGRGIRDEVTIAFEFDSDENVQKNYKGDYWFRLH